MDAHLFRRVAASLQPLLPGTRIEKIHQPGSGVTVFTLYGYWQGHARKQYLVLKAERKAPFIFLADSHLPVRAHPPAPIMRLRKYLSGHRIAGAQVHWTERRIYLEVAGEYPLWLLLDLREGPGLVFEAPPEFSEPDWPEDPLPWLEGEAWRQWPVLTPALRRTLPYLDKLDARALLADLHDGGGDVFLYENGKGEREVSAWPLLPAQLPGAAWTESTWEDPLAPVAMAGEKRVFAFLSAQARQAMAKPFASEAARLARLEQKLDEEANRLQNMCAGQTGALLLQNVLYRLNASEKLDRLTLDGQEIKLDPSLTIQENMEAMFHKARRGKRGLEHLKARREAVAREKAAAMDKALRSEAALSGAGQNRAEKTTKRSPRQKNGPSGLPKQIQAFRSSDGFLLLRGRDSKGNALVLKMAAPHDFWLHTAAGASAHVIIRREHPGQDVPEQTLRQAGILTALKSWLRDEKKAEIQFALAKYIRPLKNSAPGMVRIDRSEGTFWVEPDPALEKKLGQE